LPARERIERDLVAGHEEIALLFPLFPAVHRHVTRGEIHREVVAFAERAAAPLEINPREPTDDEMRLALELTDLQRRAIARDVAECHETDLWIGEDGENAVHERGKRLRRELLRDLAHRSADVEREDDADRIRVLRAVAALAEPDAERIHLRIARAVAEDVGGRRVRPRLGEG